MPCMTTKIVNEVQKQHNADIPLLPLLTESEQHQLAAWNATQQNYPRNACVPHLVAGQATATPGAVALVAGHQRFTYRELNQRANQLAHYLQTLGVGPNVLVGLCVERSLDMVVGLLGIIKAGGAYVPLDPTYPRGRLQYMLNDAAPRVLLTQKSQVGVLPATRAIVVALDDDWNKIEQMDVNNLDNGGTEADASQLAYVIYT